MAEPHGSPIGRYYPYKSPFPSRFRPHSPMRGVSVFPTRQVLVSGRDIGSGGWEMGATYHSGTRRATTEHQKIGNRPIESASPFFSQSPTPPPRLPLSSPRPDVSKTPKRWVLRNGDGEREDRKRKNARKKRRLLRDNTYLLAARGVPSGSEGFRQALRRRACPVAPLCMDAYGVSVFSIQIRHLVAFSISPFQFPAP